MQTDATMTPHRTPVEEPKILICLGSSSFGRAIALLIGGTTAIKGGHDALDDLCHPVGHVAIGNGYVLYTGWVHSHPVGTGDCRGPDSRYTGPDSGLEAEGTGVLRRLFFTEPTHSVDLRTCLHSGR